MSEAPVPPALEAASKRVRAALDRAQGRESAWSLARLMTAAIAALPWLMVNAIGATLPLVLSGVGSIGFAVARARFADWRAQRARAEREQLVLDEAKQRLNGRVACVRDWRQPERPSSVDALPDLLEEGAAAPLSSQERDDLDLFSAPVGLFGLINRTSSRLGAHRLAEFLQRPLLDPMRIRTRQETRRALAQAIRANPTHFAALVELRREDDRLDRLINAIATAPAQPPTTGAMLLKIWSAVTLVILAATLARGVIGNDWSWVTLALGIIGINFVAVSMQRGRIGTLLGAWSNANWVGRRVLVAAQIERPTANGDSSTPATTPGSNTAPQTPPEIDLLFDALDQLRENDALPRLLTWTRWTETGGMGWALINAILLADLHVAHGLSDTLTKRRSDLLRGLSALGTIDALASLATFDVEQPNVCEPEFESRHHLSIRGGLHPLIDPTHAVANDLELNEVERIWVITGSNMAGKSTFLRMAGINTLLAQIGSVVCATKMTLQPMRLLTDLRAQDNLAEDESYFLAEVRQLRRMVSTSRDKEPVLGLIDEPFRGTNSQEQSAASVAVAEYLHDSGNLYLLATHDHHLTDFAERPAARNVHFRENLADGSAAAAMVFDYTLHQGPATTRNALRVLEREQYPVDLLQAAQRWLIDHAPESDAAPDAMSDSAPSTPGVNS